MDTQQAVAAVEDTAGMELHQAIATVVGLLIVAMAVALIVRRLRLPYTVVLVFAGLALALTRAVPGLNISHEQYEAICFYLLLPPLLFEAALGLKWEHFSRNAGPVFTLAIPGTILSIGIVGLLCHLLLGLPLIQALLLGAIISPTDPISVLAIFRQLGVPRRLSVLMEGESLFNDAVGLVIFSILVEAGKDPDAVSFSAGLVSFVIATVGGLVVGAVLGLAASRLTRTIDDHLIEVTLSTILAYGAFLVAEQVQVAGYHFSGVIAVVVAGLWMGNYGRATGMSPKTVVTLHTFWEYAVFVVNSVIFLLIGVELSRLEGVPHVGRLVGLVLGVYVIYLITRAAVSHGAAYMLSSVGEPVPVSWRHVLTWGGLKGALSMIMVLRVPATKDINLRAWGGSDFLLPATFGVVFLSLVLQGLSIRHLVKWLGLARRSEAAERFERLVGQIVANRAALTALEGLRGSHVLTSRLHTRLAGAYEEETEDLEERLDEMHREEQELEAVRMAEARRLVYHAEKRALLDAYQRGIISADTLDDLVGELDERREQFDAEQEAPEL
ncbi:MAG: Na+/H+ antiporter [Armatimonadota bacterium]|jgi:CPA1 family monovalent cation:H+ antiporter